MRVVVGDVQRGLLQWGAVAVRATAQHEPDELQRLLELGCLTVQDKLADAQLPASNL